MKKAVVLFVLLVGVYVVGWLLAAPVPSMKVGDRVTLHTLSNIHGTPVKLPDPESKLVHLQFRRFAGCLICNLHMQHVLERYHEIQAAGIREVVIFHSTDDALMPFQGKFPFDVIGDPDKVLYQAFGVDTSLYSLLDIRAWPVMIEASSIEDKPVADPVGGVLGRPAEFLVDREGRIIAANYGRHAYDQWTVDELLALARNYTDSELTGKSN